MILEKTPYREASSGAKKRKIGGSVMVQSERYCCLNSQTSDITNNMKMSSESAGGAKSAAPVAIADRGRSSVDDGAGDDAASAASSSTGELFSECDEAPIDDSDGANGESLFLRVLSL